MIIKLFNENKSHEVCIELTRSSLVSVSESTDTTVVSEYYLKLTNNLKRALRECANVEDYKYFLSYFELRKLQK